MPQENWFPWLKKELEKLNCEVIVPQFLTPKGQKLKNCQNFFVYNSDNDPYVSLAKGKELAKNLGVKLNVIPGGGHLNAAAGYTQFPKLLEDIKKIL